MKNIQNYWTLDPRYHMTFYKCIFLDIFEKSLENRKNRWYKFQIKVLLHRGRVLFTTLRWLGCEVDSRGNWGDHLDALIKEPEFSGAIPISISLIIAYASNGTEISIQKARNENSCRCLARMRSLWRWTHVTAVCHAHSRVLFRFQIHTHTNWIHRFCPESKK